MGMVARISNTGVGLIASERRRQIYEEGRTAQHDDEHYEGELSQAAAMIVSEDGNRGGPTWGWNLHEKLAGRGDRVHALAVAGALIAADMDRLLRAERKAADEGVPVRIRAVPLEDETCASLNEKSERRNATIRIALELAVERGKVRPYEALEVAADFGVTLSPSVQRAHDHHVREQSKVPA